jgi:hypothetical protein
MSTPRRRAWYSPPLAVQCPRCAAPVGRRCRSTGGRPYPPAHRERWQHARELPHWDELMREYAENLQRRAA